MNCVGKPEGKARKTNLRLVFEGTVARTEDRFVSVVVLNSSTYGDGGDLLLGAGIASSIASNDRIKTLKHQRKVLLLYLPKLRHNSLDNRVSILGLHSKAQRVEGQGRNSRKDVLTDTWECTKLC